MSTHKLDPTVIPIPQLIELLREVEEDIKGSSRVTLPIDPHGNQGRGLLQNHQDYTTYNTGPVGGNGHNPTNRCVYADEYVSGTQPSSCTPQVECVSNL